MNKTVNIRIGTGEFDYSGNQYFYEKEVDIRSLSDSDLIMFLKTPNIDEVFNNNSLYSIKDELESRLRLAKDSELSFLYNTTGTVCHSSRSVGDIVLLKEMAKRFSIEHPIS
jgi:hypothetical protein